MQALRERLELQDKGELRVSVIIVLWNSQATIEECLRCLHKAFEETATSDWEVLVVDNASSDRSAQIVARVCPQARLFKNDSNDGFGSAVNQAARVSRGTFLLILNPDAFLQSLSLKRLMEALEARPETGIVGPLLKNEMGDPLPSFQPQPSCWGEFRHLLHLGRGELLKKRLPGPGETLHPVDVLEGACLLVRRDMFEELGGFDESFFMYSEEWDLCLRARLNGWEVACVPQARVVHSGGASSGQASTRMFQELYRSKVLYFRKHGGPARGILYKSILYLASFSRLLAALVGSIVHPAGRGEYRDLQTRYLGLLKTLHHF